MVRAMSTRTLMDQSLTLRPWTTADAATIVECVDGDPELTKWLDLVPQPYTLEDAQAYVTGLGEQAFAVTETASGEVLGSIGLQRNDDGVGEIGYWIRAEARGRGAMTQALVLLARWALTEGELARVHLRADVENLASRRVAEKAGFQLEGIMRSAHWNARLERRQDWAIYALLPGDIA
jgi:RimJ/RimL family protein N-acetyltransferase